MAESWLVRIRLPPQAEPGDRIKVKLASKALIFSVPDARPGVVRLRTHMAAGASEDDLQVVGTYINGVLVTGDYAEPPLRVEASRALARPCEPSPPRLSPAATSALISEVGRRRQPPSALSLYRPHDRVRVWWGQQFGRSRRRASNRTVLGSLTPSHTCGLFTSPGPSSVLCSHLGWVAGTVVDVKKEAKLERGREVALVALRVKHDDGDTCWVEMDGRFFWSLHPRRDNCMPRVCCMCMRMLSSLAHAEFARALRGC